MSLPRQTHRVAKRGLKDPANTKQGSNEQMSFHVHKPLSMLPGPPQFLPLLNARALEASCVLGSVARQREK